MCRQKKSVIRAYFQRKQKYLSIMEAKFFFRQSKIESFITNRSLPKKILRDSLQGKIFQILVHNR